MNESYKIELQELLEEVEKLLRGYSKDNPFVGIPTRFEPYKDQLINMKDRPRIFCHDCKSLTKECFEIHEIGLW